MSKYIYWIFSVFDQIPATYIPSDIVTVITTNITYIYAHETSQYIYIYNMCLINFYIQICYFIRFNQVLLQLRLQLVYNSYCAIIYRIFILTFNYIGAIFLTIYCVIRRNWFKKRIKRSSHHYCILVYSYIIIIHLFLYIAWKITGERNITNAGIVLIKISNFFQSNNEKINKKLTFTIYFQLLPFLFFRISKRVYFNYVKLQLVFIYTHFWGYS